MGIPADNADAILPYQLTADLYSRLPGHAEEGFRQAVVVVDREENTKEVFDRITKQGVEARAALEYVDQQRLLYLLIFGGMTCVATVALLVAAWGSPTRC